MVKLMQGYFVTGAASSEQEALPGNRAGNGDCYIFIISHCSLDISYINM